MIAPTDQVPASDSAIPVSQFVPAISEESLKEKVIIIVGMCVETPAPTVVVYN